MIDINNEHEKDPLRDVTFGAGSSFKFAMGDTSAIHTDYRSKKNRDTLLGDMMSLFEAYADYRKQNIEPTWMACYDAYRGEAPQKKSPYQSMYVLREVFRTIETQIPILLNGIFGEDRLFVYNPVDEEGIGSAHNKTEIIHRQLTDNNLYAQLHRFFMTAPKYGNSYLMYGWSSWLKNEAKLTKVGTDARKKKSTFSRHITEVKYDAPFLRSVSPWKIYTDPRVPCLRESPMCFYRTECSDEYLLSEARQGRMDPTIVNRIIKQAKDVKIEDLHQSDVEARLDHSENRSLNPGNRHELILGWTNNGWEYAVVNRTEVVKARPNMFGEAPILDIQNYPQEDEHYGISEIELILTEHALLTEVGSMLIDTAHYEHNPMFVLHPEVFRKWQYASFRPGGRIPATNPEHVKMLQVNQGSTQALMGLLNYIESKSEKGTSMTPEVTGQGSAHRTSTGLRALQSAATARQDLKLTLWKPTLIYGGQRIHDMNQAFLQTEEAMRIKGPNGKWTFGKYGPENFAGKVTTDVTLKASQEPKEMVRNAMLSLYNTFAGDPEVNLTRLKQTIFKKFDFVDPEKMVVNPMDGKFEALYENEVFKMHGVIGKVVPNENHMDHYMGHLPLTQEPEFQQALADPNHPSHPSAVQFMQHVQSHKIFVDQLLAQQGGAPNAPGDGMTNQVTPAAAHGNALAQGITQPGNFGAIQQGAPLPG